MAVLQIDELNNLGKRAIPYEKYFGEMDLSVEQIEKRVEFSKKFESILFFYLMLIGTQRDIYGEPRYWEIKIQLRNDYRELLEEYTEVDETTEAYITQFVENFVNATERTNDISEDRAEFNAENEANTVFNSLEYTEAIAQGKRFKTWKTKEDLKVRETHFEVDREKIPIDEYFFVGDSMMLYPKDTSLGASAEEIVNCRCTVEYS